jgi:molybdopterin/thiamine biosynthesis adenylyltransferase
MTEQYSRQSFLGEQSEEIFRTTMAGIVGLGGGGSHVAQQLAHIGIGNFALFDPDHIEPANLNRTVGATSADAKNGTPKVKVAERMVNAINERANVTTAGLWQENLLLLRSCDVVFGCIDGLIPRLKLEESCRRAMIPLIDIGMDVHKGSPYTVSGQVIVSMPGGPCFKCLSFIRDTDISAEESRYGHAGGAPQVIWSNGALASTAVGLFVQMLTPWCPQQQNSLFMGYDGDASTLEQDARLAQVRNRFCTHYGSSDLGDPFWRPKVPAAPGAQVMSPGKVRWGRFVDLARCWATSLRR